MTLHTLQRLVLALAGAAAIGVAFAVGATFSDRCGEHRGLYLVPVVDAPEPAAAAAMAERRPRRATLVVFDGLGIEEARTMSSLAALGERGQCFDTWVGSYTVSQPMYAVLSTGLEADRTGARNNEPPRSPLLAESLWAVARGAGLTVAAVSEIDWWQRLLPAVGARPAAFSSFTIRPRAEDFFAAAPPADIDIIHPVYVDEAGHAGGAASEGYRSAVRRADRELAAFVRTIDLERDLLVVTADHGHVLERGGHGAQQPRVAHVLTCFAGRGVAHLPGPTAALPPLQSTAIAPSLALLLGQRFPMHMRAGRRGAEPDDDLDALFRIADPAALPAAWLADRRRAVERFRDENQRQLRAWGSPDGSWRAFYHAQRAAQWLRLAGALVVAVVAFAATLRYGPRATPGRRRGDSLKGAAFACGTLVATALLFRALRGSLDATAINQREAFLHFTVALCAAVLLAAGALHYALRRSLEALRADVLALVVLALALNVAHPVAFGWTLGFPIPLSEMILFPYVAALFLVVLGLLALLLAAARAPVEKRGRAGSAEGMERG